MITHVSLSFTYHYCTLYFGVHGLMRSMGLCCLFIILEKDVIIGIIHLDNPIHSIHTTGFLYLVLAEN